MASQNTLEQAISGKFCRTVFSVGGSLVAYNFQTWKMSPRTESLNTTGFEDYGWHNGLGGVVMGSIGLQGPYQFKRADLNPASVVGAMLPNLRLYYELWLLNPEWVGAASLLRYAGVAQVIDPSTTGDVRQVAGFDVQLESRGPIYFPGQVAPNAGDLLASFFGVSGAASPSLMS